MLNPSSIREDWILRPQAIRPLPIAPHLLPPIYPSTPTMRELLLYSLQQHRTDAAALFHHHHQVPPPPLHYHPYFNPYQTGWNHHFPLFGAASSQDHHPTFSKLLPFYHPPPNLQSIRPDLNLNEEDSNPQEREELEPSVEDAEKRPETPNKAGSSNSGGVQVHSGSEVLEDNTGVSHPPASSILPEEGPPVLVDVAACDGPVWFERILNKNYQKKPNDTTGEPQQITTIDDDEDSQEIFADPNSPTSSQFYCKFCHHGFKSRSYYARHVQRHLAAVNSNKQDMTQASTSAASVRSAPATTDIILNVPYFPCKVCGSKFPSYYFVHKHRKTCHGEKDESPDNLLSLND